MNTDQLKTFLSLAETKNFSRTAETMIVSQSTISKRIFELEKELDQKLFDRGGKGVVLTRAGATFLEYAEQIVNMEDKARVQVKRTSQFTDYLVLGSVYAYYDIYLHKQLRSFSELYPAVSARIKLGHSGLVLNDLKRALIDIAFTHHPFYHSEYVCKRIGEDEVVLVTDAQNTMFAQGISFSQIEELPMLDSNFLYGPTRHRLFPNRHHFQLEFDVASCAVPLLSDSKWYTLLARKQIESLLATGRLREIPVYEGDIPPVEYYVVYRKGAESQGVVPKMLSTLQ